MEENLRHAALSSNDCTGLLATGLLAALAVLMNFEESIRYFFFKGGRLSA